MFKTRFISMLALLMTAATGAWAQDYYAPSTDEVIILNEVYNASNSGRSSHSAIAWGGTASASNEKAGDPNNGGQSTSSPVSCYSVKGNGKGKNITLSITGVSKVIVYHEKHSTRYIELRDGSKTGDIIGSGQTNTSYTEVALTATNQYSIFLHGTSTGSDDQDFYVYAIKLIAAPAAPAAAGYSVSLKDGVKDADKWTVSPNPAEEGQTVTLQYTGRLKVKGVKATSDAVAPAAGKTVDLSSLSGDYEAQNGDVLTGETTSNRVTIAAGATVTLDGVNISSSLYCIKCLGDATIILKDGSTNTLTSTDGDYPALSIGDANTTLTIQGSTGVLNVTSGQYCAGIGGGYANTNKTCGNIRIEGGVITAQGGYNGAGIGSDSYEANCGDIIITGGTITAKGGTNAAGIGTGYGSGNPAVCGAITIANTVTKVTATKGDEYAPHSIGKGNGDKASCGTVTIGGTKYWENNAAVNGGDTYLAQSPLIYDPAAPSVPDGAINGKFSVSSTKKVYFSKGNLRYASGTWSFFDNQYDYYTSYSADAWDHFGWSTSATTYGMNTSAANSDYSGDFVDWGATMGTGWFTLSSDEWTYLLKTRSASTVNGTENGRYAKAKVNNVGGIILFPDTYTHPDGVTAPTGVNSTDATGWNGNSYTVEDWTKMESAGCVFLPAAGYRNGSRVNNPGSYGDYSSATPYGTDKTYGVFFGSGNLTPASEGSRFYGCSVRLVQEATSDAPAAKEPATVTAAPTGAAIVGVGKTTALVSGGAAEGGTMMYKVTTENTKPASTDGFSDAVPTAEGITASGKVYVWYYVKGDDTHSDSEIAATAIEVPVADIVWDITNVSGLNVSGTGASYEKEGITLSGNGEEVFASWSGNGNPETDGIRFDAMASGGYTFTAPTGKKFTKIEMKALGTGGWDMANLGDGWAFNIDWETNNFTVTWTGSAASAVGLLTGADEFQGDKARYIAFYLSE